ncbi:Leucine carboxyl methyltransferase [Gracilaria domingensis]|nr:Leucine carboxyl methyltransferase [Gracilaria domingensis]
MAAQSTSPKSCVGMSSSKNLVPESSSFSFISYVSAAEKGYFDDPHLAPMKVRHQREFLRDTDFSPESVYSLSPISNHNTYVRVLLKRTLINTFVENFRDELVQVISLGSGLDTFAFQLFTEIQSLPQIRFLELDLQSVVEKKQYYAENVLIDDAVFDAREWGSSHFRAWKAHPTSVDKSFYNLRSCDLRNLDELEVSLFETGIDFSKPTLIIAEIVLVYLDPSHSDDLISFCANKFFGPCLFLDVDHVITEREFGNSMKQAFAALQLPLLGLEKYPSMESQISRFTRLGWERCCGRTMYAEFQKRIGKEGIRNLEGEEKLDEKDRSEKILSHYGKDAEMNPFTELGTDQ